MPDVLVLSGLTIVELIEKLEEFPLDNEIYGKLTIYKEDEEKPIGGGLTTTPA
jgi:hypothetical protein